ncbi:MAG: helix-turn-helix domain-containing protein [Isosphaeraceae bacterium]
MILAHKTISEDELLHHYALLPWERLYVAQRAFEEQLATVLEAGGPDPWAAQPKSYKGLAKTKKVAELRSAGVSASVIADQLSISVATVYRLLQPKEDPSRRGNELPVVIIKITQTMPSRTTGRLLDVRSTVTNKHRECTLRETVAHRGDPGSGSASREKTPALIG